MESCFYFFAFSRLDAFFASSLRPSKFSSSLVWNKNTLKKYRALPAVLASNFYFKESPSLLAKDQTINAVCCWRRSRKESNSFGTVFNVSHDEIHYIMYGSAERRHSTATWMQL